MFGGADKPTTWQKLADSLKQGAEISTACRNRGIGQSAVKLWRKPDSGNPRTGHLTH